MVPRSTLLICGLAREGKLGAGPDVMVVPSGGSRAALERRLADLDPARFGAVLSFGLAGALDPELGVGDVILSQEVRAAPEDANSLRPHPLCEAPQSPTENRKYPLRHAEERPQAASRSTQNGCASFETPAPRAPQDDEGESSPGSQDEGGSFEPNSPRIAWWTALEEHLAALGPRVIHGPVLGVDGPVRTTAAKSSLRAASGCLAVDMESHVAAAFAARHGLPFGILRVISDGADQAVPPAAAAAMREDGGIDVAAVLRSLARNPGQIPALLRTARDGARAFGILGRVGGLLRLALGLHL